MNVTKNTEENQIRKGMEGKDGRGGGGEIKRKGYGREELEMVRKKEKLKKRKTSADMVD